MKSEPITKCRVCLSDDLVKVIDLGKQPLANTFLRTKEGEHALYPLEVYFCQTCSHAQLGMVVDREAIFSDYIYFSSPNPTFSDHFKRYAEDIKNRVPNWENNLIVEIGSNDGILLSQFGAKDKHNILGIDPAQNIDAPVPTWREIFTSDTAKRIVKEKGKKAKVIMANNVFAHTFDLHDTVRGFSELLDDNGIVVIEAPWIGDMFEHNAYDTIYHEHLSYFSITALVHLFSRFGFSVVDLEFYPVHGNSFRIFVKKEKHGTLGARVKEVCELEQARGWTNKEAYFLLAKNIEKSKDLFLKKVQRLKSEGKVIVGYGAPAKANTIINFANCGEYIESIVDGMPSKIGLYTPGARIRVVERSAVNPDVFILFAWNYKDHIFKKEAAFTGEWIIPNQL